MSTRTTTELNHLLEWKPHKLGYLAASLGLQLLAQIVRALRFIVRIKTLERLQRTLHAWSREFNAKHKDLPQVTYAEVEAIETLIPVPDDPNVMLTGTLYLPANRGTQKLPAVLIRTPYDRNSPLLGPRIATLFAERGYGCLIQDTRGRFGSGGDFFPILHEVNDGGTTVAWLRAQEWCSGKVGTFGISYLGLTSYASTAKERVDACVPVMASSRLFPILFHGGQTFAFDLVVRWLWLVMNLMQDKMPFRMMYKIATSKSQLAEALHPAGLVPIHERDEGIVGKQLHFYRDVYQANTLQHQFWHEKDMLCDLTNAETRPPLSIVAGWYDFFTKQSFEDFLTATKSSPQTPLTMICGSWSHWDFRVYSPVGFHAAFALFEAQLKHTTTSVVSSNDVEEHKPHELILHVIHSEKPSNIGGVWLKLHSWPPANAHPTVFQFKSGARLELAGSTSSSKDGEAFTINNYNPEDPTPHAGGMSFDWKNSGRMTQNELEARSDVATFTSDAMAQDTTVVGNVCVTLNLWSSNKHTDFFFKLCDVDEDGNSFNVLEHIVRLGPDTAPWDREGFCKLEVDMGPTAVMFQRGHAIRVQISGGAHPAYLRHPGMEDHTSMELQPTERKIMHDASGVLSSWITLPVLE